MVYGCIYAPGIAASGIARHFSPQVEAIDPATVVMDLTGMERLIGTPRAMATAIAQQAGPEARIAIASNRTTAVHAARGLARAPGLTVIAPGEEAAQLAELPVTLLETGEDVRAILTGWGVYTFGQLAALPEAGVAERLGAEGVRLQKLARGVPGIPLKPDVAPLEFFEEMELEHPVELLEPLAFILSRQLHTLCDRLASYGLSALELHLVLTLVAGTPPQHIRAIRLPVPMRNPITFLKLLQLDLEAHPPGAAIAAVTLRIVQAKPRSVQEGLFLPPAPEAEKLELTLQRIAALVGKDNVGSPALVDSHRPGAFTVRPAMEASGRVLSIPPATLAFRAFRPPIPARVTPAGGATPPQQVWAIAAPAAAAAAARPARVRMRKIEGRVLTTAGPWRTSGDWWTNTPWARDDWDLSLSNGALYRIYREYFTGAWFVDGEYD